MIKQGEEREKKEKRGGARGGEGQRESVLSH